jgi:ABC-type Fe3+-hydroxamate transport system substrate-binding protein
MTDPVKKLKELEESLKKASLEKANLEGKKEAIMKELEEVFEVSSIEEAEELLTDYQSEIDSLEKQMKELIDKASILLG